MPDQDCHIGVIDILIYNNMVAMVGIAEIYQMLIVLAVVAGNLPGRIELIKKLIAQNRFHLRHSGAGMQAVRNQQQDILFSTPAR